MNLPDDLLPGDCLCYRPSSLFGWIIAVKTWNRISHVEGYFGRGWSIGAREKGVDFYDFRRDHLARVLRPKKEFDMPVAQQWFQKVKGQKYDFLGLLCFTLAVKQGAQDRMFCSEFMTRWYRAGNFHAIAPWIDADHVAPAQFLQSTDFDMVWFDSLPV